MQARIMLVGLGRNNVSTFVAGILTNKKQTSWETKRGTKHSNFQASFTQCAIAHAGFQYMKKLVNCKIFSTN
jgi:myo-inositol-1-phosphate synthase